MLNRKIISLTILLAAILTLSTFSAPIIIAQTTSTPAQWDGPMGDFPYNLDYSPQTQVSPSNVADLQLAWVFPVPAAPANILATVGPSSFLSGQGTTVTPLIYHGIVYTITDFQLLIALSASNGAVVWTKNLSTLNATGVPNGGPDFAGHYHSLYMTQTIRGGQPLIWVASGSNYMFAFNALTGDLNVAFDPHIGDLAVPGNFGTSYQTGFGGLGTAHDWMTVDEKNGVMLIGSAASEGTDAGRGFFEAYNVSATVPQYLWRVFTIPPQDGSDPNWDISDIQNMSYAWAYEPVNNSEINLKSMVTNDPTLAHTVLYDDWGTFGFNGTKSFAGSDTGWGGAWAVDLKTGIAYVGTDQAAPDWNATTRPGLDLWSDSIMAINLNTGKVVWAFQTTSHDMWDWDCSWGVALANATINGVQQEVVDKGCKNGMFYELNAQTGSLIWAFNAPSERRTQYSMLNNPLNSTAMHLKWASYPTPYFLQNPTSTGGIESNPAIDPTTNTVYFVTYNDPSADCISDVTGPKGPYGSAGLSELGPCSQVTIPANAINCTLNAVNMGTGVLEWSYSLANVGFRGGISITNGIVIVPISNGYIDFINDQTGKLIAQKFIDGALVTQMAIGTTADGKTTELVMPASGAIGSLVLGFVGFPTQPGYIFSLALPANFSVSTSSVTLTSTTTIPGQTVTSTTSTSSGVNSTLFYAVVAVAVIFVILTGFFAARRGRKPAT